MYILGVSGWIDRGHDASASLIKNGELVAAAEEERFTRKKHSYDVMSYNSIRFCLNEAKIGIGDIDYIAFYWDLPSHYKLRGISMDLGKDAMADRMFPKSLFEYGSLPEIKFMNHHLSHAASAFRSSGFEDSAIIVVDGGGESSSSSIWQGNGNEIKLIREFDIASSLGYFYEGATSYVGLENDEPGKAMGLASYGKPVLDAEELFDIQNDGYKAKMPEGRIVLGFGGVSDEQAQVQGYWVEELSKKLGPENKKLQKFDRLLGRYKSEVVMNQRYMDAAASAQGVLESLMIHLTKIVVEKTGIRNLCISGGVGLNCVANGKILHSGLVDDIFIQPAANDSGCSLGAAMELYASLGEKSKFKMSHAHLGPEFSGGEIEGELIRMKIPYGRCSDIESYVSELLSEGKIVGWFQGRMEWGPRALGNRSILADPRNPGMRDKVNNFVKFREWFRPFSPSMMREAAERYLIGAHDSPFMLLNFEVTEKVSKEIPAVVHVDRTTRPQTVDYAANPRYYRLIQSFDKLTGIPLILNTSFNVKGEPIVCTPADAVKSFYSTGMDCLTIGDFIVEK